MQDKKTLLRQKWIEALESGEYTQCKDSYQRADANCAIGLAAKIIVNLGFENNFDDACDYAHDGLLNGEEHYLIPCDNDNGMTFKQIATKLRNGEYDVEG